MKNFTSVVILLLQASGAAWAGPLTTTTTAAATSGASLEVVDSDPFTDVFEGSGPTPAPAPSGANASPAPAPQPVADRAKPAPAPAQPGPQLQSAPPAAPSDAGLYLGPYLRLSGLAVRDADFGLIAPFGALVRLEGGLEVAPFAAAQGLAFEAGLGLGVQSDTSFERVKGQFVLTSFQVSAIYRQPLFTYLAAYGRATGAANLAHLRLAKGLSEKEVDDLRVSASVAGTLGLELTIPLGFTPQGGGGRQVNNYLGFFFEAGYELHSSLQFDGARRDVSEDSDPARIAISGQSLGDLSLSGWIWRLGGSFRF